MFIQHFENFYSSRICDSTKYWVLTLPSQIVNAQNLNGKNSTLSFYIAFSNISYLQGKLNNINQFYDNLVT